MCQPVALITLVVVTCARLRVVTVLFQPQRRSDTVLAALPWLDQWTVNLELSSSIGYAAAILYRRSVVT